MATARKASKAQMPLFQRRIVAHGEAAVGDLIDNPRNWRLHPDHQSRALTGSLRQIGWVQSVMVNQRTGLIVDGHLRVKVAREAGEKTVPVIYVDLTDVEERAVLASLDAITSMAGTDQQALDSLVDSIDLSGVDEELAAALLALRTEIESSGPSISDVNEEDVAAPPAEPRTKPGDLWVLGDHLLLCGDSLDQVTVDRLVEPGMADLVFTDPPYGVSYEGKTEQKLTITNDRLVGDGLGEFLSAAFRSIERALRQCLIWVKDSFVLGRQDYHWRHESVLYGWKEGAAHFFVDDRTQDTVWEIPRPKASRQHPTMKPVDLVTRAIENSSTRGAMVLDLFAGSGTVALACEARGRRARMIELDPGYCDVIVDRWEAFTSRKATLAG